MFTKLIYLDVTQPRGGGVYDTVGGNKNKNMEVFKKEMENTFSFFGGTLLRI